MTLTLILNFTLALNLNLILTLALPLNLTQISTFFPGPDFYPEPDFDLRTDRVLTFSLTPCSQGDLRYNLDITLTVTLFMGLIAHP